MDVSTQYVTSDLYLTAYLKVKGFKFSVEKIKSKSNFVFTNTPDLIKNVNEYLSEMGSCEPLAFTNAIKNLKNYLHNNK
jgi:hypothetical protein